MNDRELEARVRADLRAAAEQPVPDALARTAALTTRAVRPAAARSRWPRAVGGLAVAGAAVVVVTVVASLMPSRSGLTASMAPTATPSASPAPSGAASVSPSAPTSATASPSPSPVASVAFQTGPFTWRPLDTAPMRGVSLDAVVARPDGSWLGLGRASLIVPDAGAGWSTTAWQSADGAAWVPVPGATAFTAATPGWNAVALAVVRVPSGYAAVGMDQQGDASSANAAAWYSADGVRWSRAAVADSAGRTMGEVLATSSGLVALGEAGYSFHAGMGLGTAIWTSTDGRSWSRVPAADAPPAGTRLSNIVAAPGGGYLATAAQEFMGATTETVKPVSAGVWHAADAVHWSPVAGSPLGVASMAVRGSVVVAVGSGRSDLSQPALAWTWAGGPTWSRGALPAPAGLPSDATLGASVVVATGLDGMLAIGQRTDNADTPSLVAWSSLDGASWTADALSAPAYPAVSHVFPLRGSLLVVGEAQPDAGPVPLLWLVTPVLRSPQIPEVSPGSSDPAITGASDVPCPGGHPCGPVAGTATPTSSGSAADCRPGDVAASLRGYGGAGGTMYVAVEITSTHAPCSLAAAPMATAVAAAGARVIVGAAPEVPAGSRVTVSSSGILFRIAVTSWCETGRLAAFDLILDRGNGLEVSVALPADFAVPCSGSATSLSLNPPIQP